MRWFGTDWGAPVCEDEHVETPVGSLCDYCRQMIGPEHRGVVLVKYERVATNLVGTDVPVHLPCMLDAVLGPRLAPGRFSKRPWDRLDEP